MSTINLKSGDTVITDFSSYQHWSIVSDRVDSQGTPFLISASKRTGTVKEEPWNDVVQGQPTKVAIIEKKLPNDAILARAKTMIGKWQYAVISKNCEHFVNWASNEEITSKQVVYGAIGFTTTAVLYTLLAEKPKLLGWGLLISAAAGLLSVAAAKPASQEIQTKKD